MKVLDSYTLADLSVNASALSAILAANGPAMGVQVLQPKQRRDSQRMVTRPRRADIER